MQAAGNLRHIPFRYEWYSLASTDATAFYLYLANAALLHSQITLQDNSSESAKYFGICLNQVVERLQEETAKVSPGLMLVIVGFACYDVSYLSCRVLWAWTHTKSLRRIKVIGLDVLCTWMLLRGP